MISRYRTIRRQRPSKGGRVPLPACVLRDIQHEVERCAARYGVSRSFVVAVALADAVGVDDQEHYLPKVRRKAS